MSSTLVLGRHTVDLSRRTVHRDGAMSAVLTTREAALLAYLADHADRVVGRDELLREVWGFRTAPLTRAVDNAIRRLRAKIEEDTRRPDHLFTEYGTGYRLVLVGESTVPEPAEGSRSQLVALGSASFDPASGTVVRGADRVVLRGVELSVVRALLAVGGRTVDPRDLERKVWGRATPRSSRLYSAVRRIRRKLGPVGVGPDVLPFARGEGYRLRAGAPDGAVTAVVVEFDDAEGRPARREGAWNEVLAVAVREGGYPGTFGPDRAVVLFECPLAGRRAASALASAGYAVGAATGLVAACTNPVTQRVEPVGPAVALAARSVGRAAVRAA